MVVLRISEADLARDLPAVLEKVRLGEEVVVERDTQPVAVIRPPDFQGRPIDECIALAKAHGSHATLDDDFAADLEEIINSHREPLNPPRRPLPTSAPQPLREAPTLGTLLGTLRAHGAVRNATPSPYKPVFTR